METTAFKRYMMNEKLHWSLKEELFFKWWNIKILLIIVLSTKINTTLLVAAVSLHLTSLIEADRGPLCWELMNEWNEFHIYLQDVGSAYTNRTWNARHHTSDSMTNHFETSQMRPLRANRLAIVAAWHSLHTKHRLLLTHSDDWCCRRLHNEDKDPHRLLHRVPQLLRTGRTEIIIQQQQQQQEKYLKATLKQQHTAGAGLDHVAFKKVMLHTDFTSTCQKRKHGLNRMRGD